MTVRISWRPEADGECVAVSLPDLELANRAMAEIAAEAPGRRWPADVRFAAPPNPVVAVPGALSRLDGAVATLTDAGARVMTVDTEAVLQTGMPPDGVDVLMVPTAAVGGDLFDTCAVAVVAEGEGPLGVTVLARPFDCAVALDVAALVSRAEAPLDVWPLAVADHTELVVFGAHLRGGPLAHQLTDLGARWAGELTTAPRYRMTVLPTTPAKPAITRVPDQRRRGLTDGPAMATLPCRAWADSWPRCPHPMQLGKVEFDDGTWRTAFGCDGAAATGKDISSYGSWPAAIAAGAV